ncbi:MAG: type II secretion system F family protein, partial [Acidimicrobiales bacterium]
PLARHAGSRVAALFGVTEELDLRLRRIHSPLDVTGFRVRQLMWAGAALLAGLLVAGLGVALPIAALCVLGAPLLAFLVLEQRVASASEQWKDRVRRELPVVGEQLAMLLNAGYSLGSALNRIATRSHGACARDVRVVGNRIRQGVGETQALREWAEVAQVDALDRLVGVLAMNSEASDLGRLVGIEARQGRRDLQRHTTEVIERRAQQVWVPVTVATLVPGVILLAIPFLSALRLFSSA